MTWRQKAPAKTTAQRQAEFRQRRAQWEPKAQAALLASERLHRAMKEAETEQAVVPAEFLGETPLETMENIASYYLAEAQAIRMERFMLAAGNKKTAAPRKRKAAA
jgi:multidrug efflux pump subunit AcrA (membrane-fusion protein)